MASLNRLVGFETDSGLGPSGQSGADNWSVYTVLSHAPHATSKVRVPSVLPV